MKVTFQLATVFLFFAALLAAPCALSNPRESGIVTGQTFAGPQLQHDVIAHPGFAVILESETGCTKVDAISAKVVQAPTDQTASASGVLLKAQWEEVWTVSACQKTAPVFVIFRSDGKGGTDFGISAKQISVK